MTKYDFNRVINRKNTYSTQWDYIVDRFGRNDILPFSISDTDFPVPIEVQSALTKRLQHPIYGYSRWNHDDYKNSIRSWFERDSEVHIDSDWIVYSPSVVFTIATLIKMNSDEGDTVALFTPMYDAFYGVIEQNQRVMSPIRLNAADKGYQIDWDTLTTVLSQPATKVFLLTNPHNPTGKIFTSAELTRIYQLCQQHHVFLISDDIHRDIVYAPNHYTPITTVGTHRVALCCSGSKTFNTPGLIGSYAFMPEAETRNEFLVELKQKNALSSVSILGMIAQMTAYNESADYVSELIDYLKENMAIITEFINSKLPELQFVAPEATYLAWINITNLNMTPEALQDKLVNVGRVGIMSGATYGDSHYLRMNVACPRVKLEEGLQRLYKGIRG